MKLKITEPITAIVEVENPVTILRIADFDTAVGAVSASLIEAKGDLFIGTGAGQVDNLTGGNDGEVLTRASSAALGVAWASPSGGVADHTIFNARLTLATGTPVTTTDQTAKTTVYMTPYNGNLIGLYYDSAWARRVLTEISVKTQDTQTGTLTNGSAVVTGLSDTSQLLVGMKVSGTGVPAGATISTIDSATRVTLSANATADGAQTLTISIPASTVVDMFVYWTGSAPKLEMVMWSNATTRATALALQDGVYVKSGDATRRYAGTIRTTATDGQTADSNLDRLVWNCYNRLPRTLYDRDATDSWTAGSVWRYWNNSSAHRFWIVLGLQEEPVHLLFVCRAGTSNMPLIGIGVDNTDPAGAVLPAGSIQSTAIMSMSLASYDGFPGLGHHALNLIEFVNNGTLQGDSGFPGQLQSGAAGWVYA